MTSCRATRAGGGEASRQTGRGEPLPSHLRSFFEPRFAHGLGGVLLHSDAPAAAAARAVGARAYTVGEDIVFGTGQYAPETSAGRTLLAHELAHVVQQSESSPRIQRAPEGDAGAEKVPPMPRIYSFGPTGSGRMATDAGTTIFSPPAPLDAKGSELVRAGTPSKPVLSRFGRYFTLDERSRPYPSPVPEISLKFVTEWKPDDGSAPAKSVQESSTTYYGPGQRLGTTFGDEWIFSNDRPGHLTIVYVWSSLSSSTGSTLIFLGHDVHFVDDPAAPTGSILLPEQMPHSSH